LTRRARAHVCLSSIDWNYLWQGPQEVMTRLARSGSQVLFVEHMGVRRPYLADWRRVLQRALDWGAHPVGRVGPEPGIRILSPVVLPFPWSSVARSINRVLFADRLPERAKRLGMTTPVIWTFVPTPVAVDTIRAFRGQRGCAAYYCVADFEAVTDRPALMRASEDALLSEVDVVFVGGRVLRERFEGRHDNVILAPFSVADHFFATDTGVPNDLQAIPHPRVGYIGGLHRHIDQPLLERVAALLPDVQFVFVGPKVSGDWHLEQMPNVHMLGRREHELLPAYVDGFDVGLVPYSLSEFTETVWPTKLHEYLARGKPVVSTPLPEVRLLGYDPHAVRIGGTPETVVEAIQAALADLPRWQHERQELARVHTWTRLVDRMTAEIDRCVGAPNS